MLKALSFWICLICVTLRICCYTDAEVVSVFLSYISNQINGPFKFIFLSWSCFFILLQLAVFFAPWWITTEGQNIPHPKHLCLLQRPVYQCPVHIRAGKMEASGKAELALCELCEF